jgi:isopropylmalate/homocitrate/citramalate synthase
MKLPDKVTLREVGLRDGLQSRTEPVPTELKARMFRGLVEAGYRKINAVALVHPRVMPHMADAEALLEMLGPVEGVVVSALAPNAKALERALRLAKQGLLDEVLFIHATTASILEVNGLPGDLEGALLNTLALAEKARQVGLRTVVFISATFGCSIEGRVATEVPLGIAGRLYDSGSVDEVCFSDSTGQANPRQVFDFFSEVKERFPGRALTAHFHDTRGAGLANVLATLQVGLPNLTLDSAFAGLGGDVPFLPEAAGNVCTEDLISMLEGCGVGTGVHLGKLLEVAQLARDFYSAPVPSHVLQVGPVKWRAEGSMSTDAGTTASAAPGMGVAQL